MGLPLVGAARTKELTLFVCRNITAVIRNQQKKSDQIYQDAIETNFSHEQMNPLNIIITNSNVVNKRLHQLAPHLAPEAARLLKTAETQKLMKAIKQSAMALWYFNQNQI